MNPAFHAAADVQAVPMLAAGDNIWILLAMAIIGGISTWLQNRNKSKEEQQTWSPEDDDAPASPRRNAAPPIPPSTTPQGSRELDWEAELKRILGEEPAPPAPTPPKLPPPIPQPPVAQPVATRIEYEQEEMEAQAARLAPMRESATAYARGGERTARGGSMQESAEALARAASIESAVTSRMQQVNAQTEKHTPDFGLPSGMGSGRTAGRAVSPWRNPAAARQAIIASVIFGKPKGLEN
ncbi:MAG: hypothetical protein FJ386_01720 [Verrucomicrobia bacterium]|nr:hypothetical protein [Verrucomicrobiota bacterium]